MTFKAEDYVAPSGEELMMYQDDDGMFCVQSCKGDEVRWHLTFKNEADARKEFERWRK